MPYENWSDPLSQFDGGGGYNFRAGMSNNAVEAYGRGAKPISRITLANLREAGWTETKKLALLLEKKGFWSSCEWHHSGGTWYNRVNFYDPENLVEEWDELSEQEKQIHRAEVEPSKKEEEGRRVYGTYIVWGGTRKRPYKDYDQKFTGVLRNGWIYLKSGGKKKADGNHITWKYRKTKESV